MVKQGYKQTEIGLIPEEWDTIAFKDCFKILPNNTLSRAELNGEAGTVKNIHYGDILVKYGSILNCSTESIPYINAPCKNLSLMYLVNGDLVIADTAEDETVGKAIEMLNIEEQKIVSGLHTIPCRALVSDMFANGWLGYFINHSTYHNQLLPFITGTKVSAISKASISGTLILIPPIEEQERIADALSDVDSMISSLEKLIKKKKAVKQGAMQELLTGQKRLPGFTGEWMSILFKDIYEFAKEGGTPSTSNVQYYHNGKIPFIKIEHLFSKYIEAGKEFITEEGLNNSSAWLIPTESIIFSNGATIGEISINKIPVSTKQGILGIIPKELFSTEFLFYYLSHQMFLNSVKSVTTHGTMDVAYLKDMNNILLYVPKDKKEQIAIATCLADIDNEIEALEQKLAKTRQIKQGMMQQLLTGKIRLV